MKRSDLKEYFRRQYSILVEQEEEEDLFATDDEGDEGGDDEAGDEDTGGEAAGEEEAEAEAEEEEEVEVDEEDKQRFQRSIDDHLQALLIDIEADAIKSAAVQEESYSLKRLFLFESSDVSLDVDKFASEVARLILNFDAFVDVEELMLTKVRNFLLDKHGQEVADEVENLLSGRHDIRRKEDVRHDEEEVDEQVPIAVGATTAAGGGA